ncbi:hypothetical protein ANN_26267 [Periplaneta americana]|uniref:Uncharacterized protein n=1 Tax=Periplaneta americana TaxID=6978 RepID=A0ABQ8S5F3_PERAM|nr:hypothetical protein ANN_26267 [Periplaneta americana]
MVGLCESGNESLGSLKAISRHSYQMSHNHMGHDHAAHMDHHMDHTTTSSADTTMDMDMGDMVHDECSTMSHGGHSMMFSTKLEQQYVQNLGYQYFCREELVITVIIPIAIVIRRPGIELARNMFEKRFSGQKQ